MTRTGKRALLFGCLLVMSVCSIPLAHAQDARYELGRRLRAMERSWDSQSKPDIRARASKYLNQAVQSFFRFQSGEASRSLDEASLLLRSGSEPTSTERWAASLDVIPESRLVDSSQKILKLTLKQAYPVERPIIDRVGVLVSVLGTPEGLATTAINLKTDSIPTEIDMPIEGLPEGDHVLHVAIYSAKTLVGRIEVGLSVVARLEGRLRSASDRVESWGENEPKSTAIATARGLLAQLKMLAAGKSTETDVPAFRRLTTLEGLVTEQQGESPVFVKNLIGEQWVALVAPGARSQAIPARIYLPKDLHTRSGGTPLVIALHGVGGSENIFFDGYGDGAIVQLCRERGWLLVAPRSGGFGSAFVSDLIKAVAAIAPVNPRRVFLVGHSMGAAQAVAAAARDPGSFVAVAALGGGGRVGKSDALKDLPFFVGVGSDDFLIRSALQLKAALESSEVHEVDFREYASIEHLAIVQVALPDVFAFFDKVVARQNQ